MLIYEDINSKNMFLGIAHVLFMVVCHKSLLVSILTK